LLKRHLGWAGFALVADIVLGVLAPFSHHLLLHIGAYFLFFYC
jgi:hypothetical protein